MSRFQRYYATTAALVFMLSLSPAVANAGVLEDKLAATKAQSKTVKQELTRVEQRQQNVVRQISKLNQRIAELEVPLNQLTFDVQQLDLRIEHRFQRIEQLKQDYKQQKKDIERLNDELSSARNLLAQRVVAAYVTGDTGMMEQLAGSGNLSELFARQEALTQIVGLDQRIIERIANTERKVRVKRAKNHRMRADIRSDIQALDNDRAEVERARNQAQQKRDQVAQVKAERDRKLSALRSRESELGKKLDSLEEDEKVLQQAIKTGSVTFGGRVGSVSPAGLVWPVAGALVSPFGPRWGRLHAGVDIAIGAGAPIQASASGIVTYASWMSGYGNMVIIEHGGGFTTGYAHQSQIATRVGAMVSQGQVIGFVGCTGHCYGDHVHFETRINGVPQDPMRYL